MKWGMRRVNRDEGQGTVVYIHPWEIDPGQPRMKTAGRRGFSSHYVNLGRTEAQAPPPAPRLPLRAHARLLGLAPDRATDGGHRLLGSRSSRWSPTCTSAIPCCSSWCRGRGRVGSRKGADHARRSTMVIAAYNEEQAIAGKLDNSLALDYPRRSSRHHGRVRRLDRRHQRIVRNATYAGRVKLLALDGRRRQDRRPERRRRGRPGRDPGVLRRHHDVRPGCRARDGRQLRRPARRQRRRRRPLRRGERGGHRQGPPVYWNYESLDPPRESQIFTGASARPAASTRCGGASTPRSTPPRSATSCSPPRSC